MNDSSWVNICAQAESTLESSRDLYQGNHPCILKVITMLYCIIAVVGAIGNSMVVAAVVRCQQMRTVRNYFICVLAVSDFFMSTISLPFTTGLFVSAYWEMGQTMCRVVACVQTFNVFVSTMSMAAISADRYVVIVFPMKFAAQKYVVIACCFVICTIATIMVIPTFLRNGTQRPWASMGEAADSLFGYHCGLDYWVCGETGLFTKTGNIAYGVFCTLFQYLIPLTSLIFLNHQITRRLAQRPQSITARVKYSECTSMAQPVAIGETHTGDQTRKFSRFKRTASKAWSRSGSSVRRVLNQTKSTESSHSENQKRQVRIKRIMYSVVLTFGIVWLPFNIYNLLVAFGEILYRVEIAVWFHLFAMTSVCANPVIYGALNENFRNEFQRIARQLNPSCNNSPVQEIAEHPPANQDKTVTLIQLNSRYAFQRPESMQPVRTVVATDAQTQCDENGAFQEAVTPQVIQNDVALSLSENESQCML